VLLAVVLLASLCQASALESGVSVTLEFRGISVEEADRYAAVRVDNLGYMGDPGRPRLPCGVYHVLLPPGAVRVEVEAQPSDAVELRVSKPVEPAQPPACPLIEYRAAQLDWGVYGSSSFYPGVLCEADGIGLLRGLRVARVRVYPVQYAPAEGRIVFYRRINIRLRIVEWGSQGRVWLTREVAEWAESRALNSGELSEYLPYMARSPSVDYLIVTREVFQPHLQPLVELKQALGLSVEVVTVESILGSYSGRDIPEKIRSCIQSYYQQHGTRYVLLVGGVDPDAINHPDTLAYDWEVPTRYIYNPDETAEYTHTPDFTPSDYYYAGLDGTWDGDGDGVFGESALYSGTGVDEADWYPEVYVGRLTVYEVEELQSYVQKLQAFEAAPENQQCFLLLGAISNYWNEDKDGDGYPDFSPEQHTDEAELKEAIAAEVSTIPCVKLYEAFGNLTEENVVAAIEGYKPLLVNFAGHGSVTSIMRKWGSDEDGNGLIDQYELHTAPALSFDSAAQLENPPFIMYADACLTAYIDHPDYWSLADALVVKCSTGGAVAYVGGTRVTWYRPGSLYGLNRELDWRFWGEYFWNGRTRPGEALYWSKVAYIEGGSCDLSSEMDRKDLLAYVLIGDPAATYRRGAPLHAKWTFMVYLAADNNLEELGIIDINEMEAIGSTQDVNVVVQVDRAPGYDTSNGDWTTTRRYYIVKDSNGTDTQIVSALIEDLGEVNMGDPQALADFLLWAMQEYPADHYCLVLWGHGGGWRHRRPTRDVCYDDTDVDYLSTLELEQALAQVYQQTTGRVDVIAMDACLMGMIEVGYQLSSYIQVFVASEEEVPGDGFPYDMILEALAASPDMTPEQLGQVIVQKYKSYYTTTFPYENATIAAFTGSGLQSIASALNTFAQSLMEALEAHRDKIAQARDESQVICFSYYRDLYSFAERARALVPDSSVRSAAQQLMNAIRSARLAEYHGTGRPKAQGISVYWPLEEDYIPDYESLKLSGATSWDEFLQAFYGRAVGLAKLVSWIIENPLVYLILPDNQGKPVGELPPINASVSDWTAAGYIAGIAAHEVLCYDTYPDVVDQSTGRLLAPEGYGLILLGGQIVSIPVWYYEVAAGETPVYPAYNSSGVWFVHRETGTPIPGTYLTWSDLNSGKDMFIVELFTDSDGRYVLIVYGIGWRGTFAAALYFDKQMWPDIQHHYYSWYIVSWTDNGNGRVDEPGADTYTVVAHG